MLIKTLKNTFNYKSTFSKISLVTPSSTFVKIVLEWVCLAWQLIWDRTNTCVFQLQSLPGSLNIIERQVTEKILVSWHDRLSFLFIFRLDWVPYSRASLKSTQLWPLELMLYMSCCSASWKTLQGRATLCCQCIDKITL